MNRRNDEMYLVDIPAPEPCPRGRVLDSRVSAGVRADVRRGIREVRKPDPG